MKIGLYGDSFTESHHPAQHFAWYNQLATKLGGEVYNFEWNKPGLSYGKGASSTFWSYKNFLKYHEKHDLNIFIASDPLKYPKLLPLFGYDQDQVPISGLNSIEWYENDPRLTDEGQEMLLQVKHWLMISDEEFMSTVQELILQDMERRSKSKLLILASDLQHGPAFTSERKKNTFMPFGMWDIVRVMMRSLGSVSEKNHFYNMESGGKFGTIPILPKLEEERPDMIAAHMTEEANTWLANSLYNYIINNQPMELPEHIPHRFHYTKYLNRD